MPGISYQEAELARSTARQRRGSLEIRRPRPLPPLLRGAGTHVRDSTLTKIPHVIARSGNPTTITQAFINTTVVGPDRELAKIPLILQRDGKPFIQPQVLPTQGSDCWQRPWQTGKRLVQYRSNQSPPWLFTAMTKPRTTVLEDQNPFKIVMVIVMVSNGSDNGSGLQQ